MQQEYWSIQSSNRSYKSSENLIPLLVHFLRKADLPNVHIAIESKNNHLCCSAMQIYIYSAHDKNIAAFLSALGSEEWQYPGFVSHITFLVRGPVVSKKLSDYTIDILYNDQEIDIDACPENPCALDFFFSYFNALWDHKMSVEDCELRN